MYPNVQESIGMYLNVQECIGMYWNILECIVMYWNVQQCIQMDQIYYYAKFGAPNLKNDIGMF